MITDLAANAALYQKLLDASTGFRNDVTKYVSGLHILTLDETHVHIENGVMWSESNLVDIPAATLSFTTLLDSMKTQEFMRINVIVNDENNLELVVYDHVYCDQNPNVSWLMYDWVYDDELYRITLYQPLSGSLVVNSIDLRKQLGVFGTWGELITLNFESAISRLKSESTAFTNLQASCSALLVLGNNVNLKYKLK